MKKQQTLDKENIEETNARCEICGKEFEIIAGSHLKTHGMTSDEYREQFPGALLVSDGLRKRQSGVNNPMYGRTGENSPMYGRPSPMKGKHHTEASKQLMSEAQLGEKHHMHGKYLTEEHKQKISDKHADVSGKNNPNYGRTGEQAPMYGRIGENSPMYGRSGEKSPVWKGGISYLPYCEKFNNDLRASPQLLW